MNAGTTTDAALHRLISRLMTTPSTTSDHLLILADALDEAAAATMAVSEAATFSRRAAELRQMAPRFAEGNPQPARPGFLGQIP